MEHTHTQALIELWQYSADELWRAQSRWLRYEQTASADNRVWGRPAVSVLTLRSLMQLRHLLTRAAVDTNVTSPTQAPYVTFYSLRQHITATMTDRHKLNDVQRDKLAEILEDYLRVNRAAAQQRQRRFTRMESLPTTTARRIRSFTSDVARRLKRNDTLEEDALRVKKYSMAVPFDENIRESKETQETLLSVRHVPKEALFVQIFSAPSSHFAHPIMGFYRLHDPTTMDDFQAGRVPLTIAIVVLGPHIDDCHQIGRALGTLLAEPVGLVQRIAHIIHHTVVLRGGAHGY